MSFYNTGNPVPSIDPRDLDDNAKILDEFVNGTEATYSDRQGVERRSLFGVENAVDSIYEAAESAEESADRAEIAADLSAASSKQFQNTADGLAATSGSGSTNRFFTVPSTGDMVSLQYRNDAGVATLIGGYPSASYVQLVRKDTDYVTQLAKNYIPFIDSPTLDLSMPVAYCDASGNPILGVRADGYAHAVLDSLPGTPLLGDYQWASFDSEGVVLLGFKWDGEVVVYGQGSGEVTAYASGPMGAQDIFVLIGGSPYQITSYGDNFSPSASSGRVSYIRRAWATESVVEDLPAEGTLAAFGTEILHFVGSGQSLSVGSDSVGMTVVPPVANRMLTLQSGVRLTNQNDTLTEAGVLPLKPLVCNQLETPTIQMTAQLGRIRGLPANALTLTSAHGRTGYPIANLSKGTLYYNNSITAVTFAKSECDDLGLGYSVPFVNWIQGENDRNAVAGYYTSQLMQLQADYNTDISAISGQTRPLKILLDQISNWTAYNITTSFVPLEQLAIALSNPSKFVCAGPKYWIQSLPDGIHLSADNYMRLGCMHARAAEAIIKGVDWLPTHATSAVRTGDKVVLKFHCPTLPLVVDTDLVVDPGNLGLRWVDDTSSATVTSVKQIGFDEIEVTLSTVPTGANPYIGIADIGLSGAPAGPSTGARACLRDSAVEHNAFGEQFYNWACHQRINVI